jgi:hypothetical protein
MSRVRCKAYHGLVDDKLMETINDSHLRGSDHRTVIACDERPRIGMKWVDFERRFLSNTSVMYVGTTDDPYTIYSAKS